MNANTQHVSVIGTGLMGSALAKALKKGGLPVTVWNRSKDKAEQLAPLGITVASSAADAIKPSDLVIVCLTDFQAVNETLRTPEIEAIISGKTIVNYTSGPARDARESSAWATANGSGYLHGAIFSYPGEIGEPNAEIAHSGPEALYKKHESALRFMAGQSRFIGEEVAYSCLLERAMFAFYFGSVFAFYQGSAVLDAENLPLDEYLSSAEKLLPVVAFTLKQTLEMHENDDYSGTNSHLGVHLAAVKGAYEDAIASGASSDLLETLCKMMERGIEVAGGQEYELPVIFKAFKKS